MTLAEKLEATELLLARSVERNRELNAELDEAERRLIEQRRRERGLLRLVAWLSKQADTARDFRRCLRTRPDESDPPPRFQSFNMNHRGLSK